MDEKQKRSHKRSKLVLKIVGILVLAAGLGMAATGIASQASALRDGGMPNLFWMCCVGFPMVPVGVFLLALGFRREMAGYVMQEAVPVFNQGAQEAQPGLSAMASSLRPGTRCPACGQACDEGDAFCKACGAPLQKTCPACGQKTDGDSKFCSHCGKEL